MDTVKKEESLSTRPLLFTYPALHLRSEPHNYWLVRSPSGGGDKRGEDGGRLRERGIVLMLHSQKITVQAR